jgi:hypothetical protein
VLASQMEKVLEMAKSSEVSAKLIGQTGGNALTLGPDGHISIDELRAGHEAWLPNYMTGA